MSKVSRVTPEQRAAVADLLRSGASYRAAARAVGVPYSAARVVGVPSQHPANERGVGRCALAAQLVRDGASVEAAAASAGVTVRRVMLELKK